MQTNLFGFDLSKNEKYEFVKMLVSKHNQGYRKCIVSGCTNHIKAVPRNYRCLDHLLTFYIENTLIVDFVPKQIIEVAA